MGAGAAQKVPRVHSRHLAGLRAPLALRCVDLHHIDRKFIWGEVTELNGPEHTATIMTMFAGRRTIMEHISQDGATCVKKDPRPRRHNELENIPNVRS